MMITAIFELLQATYMHNDDLLLKKNTVVRSRDLDADLKLLFLRNPYIYVSPTYIQFFHND